MSGHNLISVSVQRNGGWSVYTTPSRFPEGERMMKNFLVVFVILLGSTFACAQGDEVAPNENLVVEGIPKIPVSLADAVGRYSEFRSADFTSWHPNKREMLITTRFADTAQVHQVKFPGGARTQLTFFRDAVRSGIFYEPVK